VARKLYRILNKPISGWVAEKKSPKFVIIVFLIGFLCLLVASVYMLGAKEGLIFAMGFSVFALVLLLHAQYRVKSGRRLKIKAFEDE
jgi:uncharacterized membrane protein